MLIGVSIDNNHALHTENISLIERLFLKVPLIVQKEVKKCRIIVLTIVLCEKWVLIS